MGRLVRRYIRTYTITVKNKVYVYKEQAQDITATLRGVRSRVAVKTGVTLTGSLYGVHIETEALGTGVVSGNFEGMDIETYVVSTATISGDHYGIFVKTYSDIAGNQEIVPLRLEHNGASVANAFIGVFAQTGKMRYFLYSSHTSETWCNVTQTASTAGGWLKVRLGGYDRYIALYTTVS